jgi:hypothetical protein
VPVVVCTQNQTKHAWCDAIELLVLKHPSIVCDYLIAFSLFRALYWTLALIIHKRELTMMKNNACE